MMSSEMNLVTTIIGFVLSVTFIVCGCIRLICWRLSRFEIDASRNDLDLQSENRINRLEPMVVASIPTMKFNHGAFSSEEDAQCSICLSEYEEKEVLRTMPKCGHSFHLACIDEWLKKQSTCPICRLSLQETSDSFEITVEEHSPLWLLPIVALADGYESNQMHANSIAIELDSDILRLRSSS